VTDFEFQNGVEREGFEFILEDVIDYVYLSSEMDYTYEFKIVFGVRPGVGQTRSYFDQFVGHDLKVEIETYAILLNGSSVWVDASSETIMLRNATVDPNHPIWDSYEPPTIEIFLNGYEEVTVFQGASYVDAGAVLLRNDQDISYRLIKTGEVNIDVVGEYTITYSYTSSETNQSYMVSRIVRVVSMDLATNFEYTGGMQRFVVPIAGRYMLEVWGANGGNSASEWMIEELEAQETGGRGGYSMRNIIPR